MSANRDREEEIFDTARELAADERAAYLAERCGQDADLRQRIEGMLAADAAAGEFFNTHDAPSPTVNLADASLSPSIEKAGDRIGRYKLLQQIGEGGCGVVYMAEQEEPVRRRVALKVIKLGMDTKQVIARFEAERQALALMDHPNIAKVFDAGATDSGRPYFVMELVRGIPITEYCDKNCLPTRQRLDLFILVCQAVQHAHQKGVIHRDLKPSNILVTLNDGVPWPMIIDFGIAKATHQRLTEKTLFTHFAQMIGTPAYMSPEQAEMSKLDVDTRSDIYALGVLLYELLTGTTPFSTKELLSLGYREMQRTIVEREPLRLSTRLSTMANDERTVLAKNRSVDIPALAKLFRGDLDWIAMKCLEKDRARRYETANGLARDIQRHLHNEPVAARPPSQLYRFQKAYRRNRLAFSAAALVLASMVIAMVGIGMAARRESRARVQESIQRGVTQKSLARAEAAERESQHQLYTALLEQARATVLTAQLCQRVQALESVRRAAAISNSAALRGVAIAALMLPDMRFERELPAAPDLALIQLDPAFERIALGRTNGPVEIRSVSDDRFLALLPAITNRSVFAGGMWSPNGQFLAVVRDRDTAGSVKDLEVWEVSKKTRALVLRNLKSPVVTFHPRLPMIMVGLASAEAVTWDLETGRELTRHKLKGRPSDLSFAPNGERFAVAERIGTGTRFVIYELADGAERASCLLTNPAGAIDWHPTGRLIAGGDSQGAVHIMDANTGEARLMGWHKSVIRTVSFSPDGGYLLSGGWDRELIGWDVKEMRRVLTVPLDSYRLQFRADGRQCAILRWPEVRLQLYAFEPPALYREFPEDVGGNPNHAAFSPDGRWLAASGAGRRMAVWDLTTNGPAAVLKEALEAHVNFAPNGELFCSRVSDCSRWKVRPGANGLEPILERLEMVTPQGFSSLTLVSNGLVVTGVRGSRLVEFDDLANKEGTWKRTVSGRTLASPDGQWLAVLLRSSPYLYVHGLPGLEPIVTLTNEARIQDFEFSPKGDELAVGTRLGIEFWNMANWQRIRHLTNFSNILYARDGQTFWLSSGLHTAGLYDARTTELLFPLPANTMPLALSPDDRHLAVSVDARRVQVWDLAEVRRQLRSLGLDWVD